MVANAETGNLLEVIDSHKQEEIIEALKQQPCLGESASGRSERRYVGGLSFH